MATTIWSKRRENSNMGSLASAPCTIFSSTSTLSPRQIANKALTLGCKKLDRDDKRSKQRYHVRERLLLCNTIAKAEEVLNKRTRRTNRRVLAAEEEDEDQSDEEYFSTTNGGSQKQAQEEQKLQQPQSFHFHHKNQQEFTVKQHHSPLLRDISNENEEEESEKAAVAQKKTSAQPSILPTTEGSFAFSKRKLPTYEQINGVHSFISTPKPVLKMTQANFYWRWSVHNFNCGA
ncbi:hypothetical protein BDF20DRAFT_988847 [Mycotypha africana]|uniref:uncharacterized protein n=1 Tax=Mycotypha africana TaxID=64632 RepID=UPI002301575E|nr:uncharacterized protein BDF20DRAFT_988847 [Mycotypha africana]KAI8975337.1 hypothetical protein BDF20DRAFT_988847 [Mycotypha africana]